MRLIYHPAANGEVVEAARFYERRVAGLGSVFLDAVDSAVKKVCEAPERQRIVKADIRKYLMRRFPYAIYYRLEPDHIFIVAIAHHSRSPEYWSYRAE